jgi:hypothetical protein
LTRDPLQGGHAGEWPYRYGDPRERFALALGPGDSYTDLRDPWWLPPRDRCEWSLEIARDRERTRRRTDALFARTDAADRRREAEGRYQTQRRQALAAILYGVVIMVLVIAAAGG